MSGFNGFVKSKNNMNQVNLVLGEWNTNATAIKDDTWEVVDTAIATLIAELIRNTNNDDGKSTIERIVEALPSIFGAYSTWRRTAETADHIARRDQYLSALSTAVGALNEIRAENQLAFDTYEDEYDKYLELMAASSHTGGLVRVENYSPQGNYINLTALDIEAIKTTVKAATAFRDGKLKKWYHPNDIKSSSQPTSHSFGRFHDFDSFWKLNPLPKNKDCEGSCGQQFQTPVEHLVVCPYALTVSILQAGNTRLTGLPIDTPLPDGKASPAGCAKAYYLCDSGDRNEHKVRICGKNNNNGNRCNEPYRNCNNSEYDHEGWGSNKHKEKAGNLIIDLQFGFAPASGSSYTASAGDTHTGTVTASSIYGARLYVNSSLMGWFGGSTTATSLSLSYTFPSDASGDYTMMARVYPWDGDTYGNYTDYSYTVTISSDDTTTPMHVCGIHELWQSGDHSSTWLCNESPCSNRQVPYCLAICPYTDTHGTATTPMHVCEVHELWESGDHSWITPACGVSDHAGDACQIDVSHETSVSCPQENGVSCSYENYYTCSPHTHAYPVSFSPSVSLDSSSYRPGDTLIVTVSTSGAPIYGARLYHGSTDISGWSGGSQSITSLNLSYTLPTDATGRLNLRVSIWPWRGDTYGSVHRLYFTVDVQ